MSILADEVTVRKNSGADIGARRRLNYIEGANVTLTIADDPTDQEIDVTVASAVGASASRVFTYLVYESAGTYYAIATATGAVTSNASFSTLMNTLQGHIYLNEGTYSVDASVVLDVSYMILEGAGWRTLLSLANGVDSSVITVTAGNCSIRNLRIYGNNANNAGTSHGIYVYRSAGHRFENLKIYDCETDGIHLGEPGVWDNAKACLGGKITGCYIGDASSPNTGHGIYVDYHATDWEIINNVLASHTTASKSGIAIDGSNTLTSLNHMWGNYYNAMPAIGEHMNGWQSVGDKFMDNVRHGIYKATGHWWANSNITGGYFWRSGDSVADTYDAIKTVGNVRCVVVSGCSGRGENSAGTHMSKYFWNADANVISSSVIGCILEGYNEAAPIAFAGAGCLDQHNILYDCS